MKKKTKKKVQAPAGIIIEGTKASLEAMTASIVTVLKEVQACGMNDDVAESAMETLTAVAKNTVYNTIQDCAVYVTPTEED